MSLPADIRGIQNSTAGIVLSLTDKNVPVPRQIVELSMQQVRAITPAKMGRRVRNGHEYRVTPDFVPDEEPIGIGAAVRRGTEVDDEGVVKLIGEAGVSRLTAFPELTGLAAGNLNDQGLIVLRAY